MILPSNAWTAKWGAWIAQHRRPAPNVHLTYTKSSMQRMEQHHVPSIVQRSASTQGIRMLHVWHAWVKGVLSAHLRPFAGHAFLDGIRGDRHASKAALKVNTLVKIS
jgi:hypothetical protein